MPKLISLTACITITTLIALPAFSIEIETAQEQFKTGKYAECLESAQKAIEDSAYSVDWRILLIESMMELGQYAKAADTADTALMNYPVSLRLLELGYRAYLHNGQQDRAADVLSRAFRIGSMRDVRFMNSADLTALGKSLLHLGGEPRLILDEFFNRAIEKDPNCLEAYLAAGDLALAKQDYDLAASLYDKALKRFGTDPDVHYGLAKAFVQNDRAKMIESLDAALYVNQSHQPSLLLLAEHQIDCEDYDAADKLLTRTIDLNPWNPQAWAYRAILANLDNDSEAAKQYRAKALKYWPTNPEPDYLIGKKLSQKYRFTEGAAYQRQALKLNAGYLPAKIQLAQDLLRLGAEQEGWTLADEVHKKDAYNIEAYNLVNLRDHLETFETLRVEGLIIRMDKLESAVYGQEVIKLLRQAKSELCKKYALELTEPVTVELFPNQQDFAVRTFGMPGGDGFLGVCFGNVITANSPKPQRPSNWQAMLWHEFCHVITLNLTHNKMPRWLSEGISVYEEMRRDPTWGQHMNPQYRRMIIEGKLTPVGNLSAAFMNAPGSMQLQFAYYQSALVVEFLVDRFGYEALRAILADLANGEEINDAISKHTEPIEQIEKDFDVFARKRAEKLAPEANWEQPESGQFDFEDPQSLAGWLAEHPNSFWALSLQANKLLAERKFEEAKKPLEKLISLYPHYTGEDNAYRLLAQVHRELGETEQERDTLNKLASISSDDAYAYGRLMEINTEQKNWQEVVTNGRRYMAVYPLLASVHWQLGRANEELSKEQDAVESYRRLLLLEPENPVEVRYRLARLLRQRDPVAAKRHILEALAEAPRFREGHKLLLDIARQTEQPQSRDSESQNQSQAVREDGQ